MFFLYVWNIIAEVLFNKGIVLVILLKRRGILDEDKET